MENLQNSVSVINSQKVFSPREAQKIIEADKKPDGMEAFVYCLKAVDAVIYPVPFGFVFVYENKVLLFQDVADWKRGVDAAALFQKGYNIVDDHEEGVTIIPFNIINDDANSYME